jgi:type I restriction enzyme S subunit
MKTKINIINNPKIRFPGFKSAWKEKSLSELYYFLQTNSLSRSQLNYEAGSVKNIHYGDIHMKYKSGFYIQNENVPYITSFDASRIKTESYCKEGDLVVADASEDYKDIAKAIELIDLGGQKILAGLHTFLLRKKEQKKIATGFSQYLMQLISVRKQIMRSATGISVLGISKANISKIKVSIPSYEEQQKISSFLRSVDLWIENLRMQKDEYESYKKGMMRKVFSQEIRFKDDKGKVFPKWKEKKLGEVCDIKTGKKDVNEGNPNGKYPFFTCAKEHTYSDYYSFDCEAILIAGNGEVGLCQKYSGKFEAYQRTYVLSAFTINPDYLFTILNSKFKEEMLNQRQMGAMPYIKLGMLKNFLVTIPASLEQQKIADFLSSMDKIIESKQQQITQTEQWKKSLMQNLFA